MRLCGYKHVERAPGVRVYEEATFEVSLRTAISAELGSTQALGPPGIMAGRREFSVLDEGIAGNWNRPGQICLRGGASETSLTGLLVYESLGELFEFLAARVVPQGDDRLSHLVSRLSSGSESRGDLEREVLEAEDSGDVSSDSPRGLPVLSRERFKERFRSLPSSEPEERYVPTAEGYQRGPLLVRPLSQEVGGRTIPRWAYLIPTGVSEGSRNEPILHFDGQRLDWLRSIHELRGASFEAFDREGALYRAPHFDVLPSPHLRVRCLVKIPSGPALAKAWEHGLTISRRHPLLKRAGYVVDSRAPIALRGGEPVLENPTAAVQLLASTTRGIYVPGDRQQPEPPACSLLESESWAVVLDVNELP
ncbi:MAG: hypothetical protein JKY65_02890 [Planctomycetes bacterium]|nr:hypothetical protein [Planctomycetota bacterium]